MAIIKVICFENFSILIVNGDLDSSVLVTFWAIFPTSVLIPVEDTTAFALPVNTEHPAYKQQLVILLIDDLSDLLTAILSPVRIDSSTVKLFDSIILQSAGILLPDSKIIISPGTTKAESISQCLASLITLTFTFIKFLRASEFLFALNSCMVETIASTIIINNIATPSNVSPTTNDNIVHIISTYIIGSLSDSKNILYNDLFFSFGSSFKPYLDNLFLTSFSLKPSIEVL